MIAFNAYSLLQKLLLAVLMALLLGNDELSKLLVLRRPFTSSAPALKRCFCPQLSKLHIPSDLLALSTLKSHLGARQQYTQSTPF
jgi:hypothetical protein